MAIRVCRSRLDDQHYRLMHSTILGVLYGSDILNLINKCIRSFDLQCDVGQSSLLSSRR